jgi:2-C-methyl-D-erythritol 2,4-cyclodiphosphate synthase
MTTIRVGQGYDIHRLCAGRKLILGGETIEYYLGLDGHSDADVICHAVMDSLLGAAALGDIGMHFPNTDPFYKDSNSIELMRHVEQLITQNSFRIGNIDITVIAEKPKLAPYIPRMITNISKVLGIEEGFVSIKATTNEQVGFIGRGEGIAALSVALIYK